MGKEEFLEKYRREAMPYFKIFKGEAVTDKKAITRFVESQRGAEGYDLVNEGAEILEAFFASFPDGGKVTIETKGSIHSGPDSANYTTVKWGDGASVGSTGYHSGGNILPQAANPMQAFSQFKEMFAFMGSLYSEQMKAQVEAIKAEFSNQVAMMKMQKKWEEEKQELMAELMQPDPGIGETLTHELIGLIRPVAQSFLAKNNPAAAVQLPALSGMEKTTTAPMKKPAKTTSPGAAPAGATPPPAAGAHPMQNASMDLIFNCVRAIAENVFPDYNVNEVMPALAHVSVQHRDIIRQFVEPIIQANRQRAHAAGSTNDEEE